MCNGNSRPTVVVYHNYNVYKLAITDIAGLSLKHHLRYTSMGFNIVWSVLYTSIASTITPDYFKTCLYHPLSGRQRVGRRVKPSSVGVVTVQRSLLANVCVVTL